MPRLKRSDGAEIQWEERGEGPTVLVATQFFSYPEALAKLLGDLARDHRVVTYHVRGTGDSSRLGPYDLQTDGEDLTALVEQFDEPVVLVAMGDGVNRAVKAAALVPERVMAVISAGGSPIGTKVAQDSEGLAGSSSVLEALVGMLDTDYRSGLRTMLDTANPQFDREQLMERLNRTVEHCPREAAVPRLRSWIADDSEQQALKVGSRLWLLEHGGNPWFPESIAHRTRQILPEAHVIDVEDGPLSRPDIAAGYVRRVTARAPVGQSQRSE
jgi:pimeloyl-ACP methyl ester carboxylesterase